MNRFFRMTLSACAITLGASAATAQVVEMADYEYYRLAPPVENTRISGRAAGQRTFLRSNILRQNGFLKSINIDERRDAPCQLRAEFNGSENEDQSLNACGTSTGATAEDFEGWVGWDEGVFVDTVQICLNNSRTRVKGVRFTGNFGPCREDGAAYAVVPKPPKAVTASSGQAVLNRSGHYLRKCTPSWTTSFTRNNCSGRWETAQSCSDGKVAYGVQLRHIDGNGGRRQIVGIGLHCARLVRDNN